MSEEVNLALLPIYNSKHDLTLYFQSRMGNPFTMKEV